MDDDRVVRRIDDQVAGEVSDLEGFGCGRRFYLVLAQVWCSRGISFAAVMSLFLLLGGRVQWRTLDFSLRYRHDADSHVCSCQWLGTKRGR